MLHKQLVSGSVLDAEDRQTHGVKRLIQMKDTGHHHLW